MLAILHHADFQQLEANWRALQFLVSRIETDETLTASLTIEYNRPGAAAMTIVDLGIPPGFGLVEESLKKLVEAEMIERYSITGRQAVLYFRELRGGEPVAFDVVFRARYPVRVKTTAASVYQYYEPELRDETEPVEIEVR